MDDQEEYILLKGLRDKYRHEYKFLTITVSKRTTLSFTLRGKPPQIKIVFDEEGNVLKMKLSKHLECGLDGSTVVLASPHMMTRLNKLVHQSVLVYVKNERENRIRTIDAREKQISSCTEQITTLNKDVKRLNKVTDDLHRRRRHYESV